MNVTTLRQKRAKTFITNVEYFPNQNTTEVQQNKISGNIVKNIVNRQKNFVYYHGQM